MCYVWCVMCDVWCVMCDVWCVMCDVWCVLCWMARSCLPTWHQSLHTWGHQTSQNPPFICRFFPTSLSAEASAFRSPPVPFVSASFVFFLSFSCLHAFFSVWFSNVLGRSSRTTCLVTICQIVTDPLASWDVLVILVLLTIFLQPKSSRVRVTRRHCAQNCTCWPPHCCWCCCWYWQHHDPRFTFNFAP